MRSIVVLAIIVLAICKPISFSFAQGESALPFLLIHPSPEANGRGNTGTAVVSDNPIATISNPGHLGLFSLANYFSASMYAPKTQWLRTFGLTDLTYGVWAASAGYNISEALDIPVPVGIGVGYSRIDLNLGTFMRTNENGQELGTFNSFEKSDQFSVGFGADYFLRIGVGWNFKNIRSVLGSFYVPTYSSDAKASATDFGLIIQAPIIDILRRAGTESVEIYPGIEPLFNLTFGYARSNMSDKAIVYAADMQMPDPLPRNATIGLSADFGLVAHVNAQRWKIITLTLAREAEDLLITRHPNGTFSYQTGLGDISFFKHVVRGELSGAERADLHKGWELNFGEIMYVRGGSFAESPDYGNRNYSTSGFTFRVSGLFKALQALDPDAMEYGALRFIADHIDFVYDQSKYSSKGSPLDRTSMQAISIIVR